MEECWIPAINPDCAKREDKGAEVGRRGVNTPEGQVPSILDFHWDTDLSSIRQIKLSVAAHFSTAHHILTTCL